MADALQCTEDRMSERIDNFVSKLMPTTCCYIVLDVYDEHTIHLAAYIRVVVSVSHA